MIPENNFALYVVMSNVNTTMGVYQTFGEALGRVSELLRTNRLVEERMYARGVRYYSEEKPQFYYDIHRTHFFYERDKPLVTDNVYSLDEQDQFEPDPRIVNK